MSESIRRFVHLPFYPWFLSLYPILYVYSENLGLVIEQEVTAILAFVLTGTTIAFVCTNFFLRDRYMTAILIGVSVMYFSVSGHVYGLMLAPSAVHLKAKIIVWTLFVLVIAIATIYLLQKYGSTDVFSKATGTFNLIMIALLALPSLTILSDVFWRPSLAFGEPANEESAGRDTAIPKIYDSSTNPDIYYIIPDAYPNDRWLRQVLSYDNSDFSNELKARGFVIAENAQSNYAATLHSLASTLNMQFFATNESSIRDLDYLRLSIAEGEILRYIRGRGYIYVQFLSGYLLPSPFAEINRDFTPNGPIDIKIDQSGLSAAIVDGIQMTGRRTIDIGSTYKQSFITLYLDTTLLRLLSPRINQNEIVDAYQQYGLFAPERFLDTVDELGAIAAMPEATFTLVHLMKPHGPATFDAKGNIMIGNVAAQPRAIPFRIRICKYEVFADD